MDRSRAQEWDQQRLSALVRELATGGSTALIIQQAGEPVLSAGQVSRTTSVASVRKGLISILYGIYAGEGRIDLDATLADLGIGDTPPLTPEEKRATVRDLLTSRSGVYHPSVYDIDRDRPSRGSHAPGAHFYYNNWDFNVLGTIFERATGEGLFAAFSERVAVPLGMEDFAIADLRYEHGPESRHPVYKMRLSARDLVRVGQLYLQDGTWNGQRIVSEAWVRESTRPHVDLGGGRGYGYLWWSAAAHAPGDRLRADVPLYYASGLGGQYIIVLPAYELVVVHRAARVDHGIDHGRMGEILDVVLEAIPGA
jgi:CubicO group peptidase (beta-lactamase class C family)